MDIEGAEEELLLKCDPSWLQSVDAISVEVHDVAWMDPIARVLERQGFKVEKSTRHWSALNANRESPVVLVGSQSGLR